MLSFSLIYLISINRLTSMNSNNLFCQQLALAHLLQNVMYIMVLLTKHANNNQVVVFVEEAQSMPIETLEEIRLLSNLETNENKLLQMVLFGQPELDVKLRDTSIRQLKERITHSFYLDPFPGKDIYDYLNLYSTSKIIMRVSNFDKTARIMEIESQPCICDVYMRS